MKRSLSIIAGFIIIIISACEYNYIEPVEVILPDEPVSFTQQIYPVLESKCVSCHTSRSPVLTSGNAYTNLINGDYIDTDNPASSNLYEKLDDGHPGGSNNFSATELALLLKWIQEGADNN